MNTEWCSAVYSSCDTHTALLGLANVLCARPVTGGVCERSVWSAVTVQWRLTIQRNEVVKSGINDSSLSHFLRFIDSNGLAGAWLSHSALIHALLVGSLLGFRLSGDDCTMHTHTYTNWVLLWDQCGLRDKRACGVLRRADGDGLWAQTWCKLWGLYKPSPKFKLRTWCVQYFFLYFSWWDRCN